MSERRTIGQILKGLGRITDEDVAAALEYQRDHGGFFGEALMASGVITQEELDFGIASQFDLPFVVPDPASIDLAAASLVTAEWALIHNTLPILQAGEELMVVTDSPMREEAIEHLESMTGCQISLSLSSPTTVRDTIRQVYAMASATDEEPGAPVDLSEAIGIVLLLGSSRFGISVRGALARFWWDEEGVIRRRPLSGDWRGALERSLSPSLSEVTADGPRSTWDAQLTSGGTAVRVAVDSLADESGREILFVPTTEPEALKDRFPAPPEGIVSEIRLLARSGTARFIVQADPDELCHELLPHLPELALDPAWRSVYIHAHERDGADEAFSVHMQSDPSTWVDELNALRAFHFDVVTVDLAGGDHEWAEGALDVASVAFLYWPFAADTKSAYEAGVRWVLKVERGEADQLSWSLDALNS